MRVSTIRGTAAITGLVFTWLLDCTAAGAVGWGGVGGEDAWENAVS